MARGYVCECEWSRMVTWAIELERWTRGLGDLLGWRVRMLQALHR